MIRDEAAPVNYGDCPFHGKLQGIRCIKCVIAKSRWLHILHRTNIDAEWITAYYTDPELWISYGEHEAP